MKKTAMFLVIACAILAAVPAPGQTEKQYSWAVKNALVTAYGNERVAAARYEACAAKAEAEGYPGAATLFRTLAKAERVHLARFKAALERGKVEYSEEQLKTPEVGSTSDNLWSAAASEQRERDGTYRDAREAAAGARDEQIAKLFEVTRDAETEHANLCTTARQHLDQLKQPHEYFVCSHCGYVTDFTMPLCPSCREQRALESVD